MPTKSDTLGSRIRARRIELGMTQTQLAAAIGVATSRVGNWETGANDNPTLETLRAIAKGLQWRLSTLLSGLD